MKNNSFKLSIFLLASFFPHFFYSRFFPDILLILLHPFFHYICIHIYMYIYIICIITPIQTAIILKLIKYINVAPNKEQWASWSKFTSNYIFEHVFFIFFWRNGIAKVKLLRYTGTFVLFIQLYTQIYWFQKRLLSGKCFVVCYSQVAS